MKAKSLLLLAMLAIFPMAALAGQPSDKVGVVTSAEPGKVARQVDCSGLPTAMGCESSIPFRVEVLRPGGYFERPRSLGE